MEEKELKRVRGPAGPPLGIIVTVGCAVALAIAVLAVIIVVWFGTQVRGRYQRALQETNQPAPAPQQGGGPGHGR